MPPNYNEVDKSNELVTIILETKHKSPKLWGSKNVSIQPSHDNIKFCDNELPECNISMGHVQECPKVRCLMDELLSEICAKTNKGLPEGLMSQNSYKSKSSKENFKSINWQSKDVRRLREEKENLEKLIACKGNELVKYLKRKSYLLTEQEAHFNIITACVQAMSPKTRENTKMKFSFNPKGETGFSQWLDAMKMVAQLPGGMPPEFRTKLWLQLSEKHLNDQNVDWEKAEGVIFNESTNPDDEELGVQIVKDLHRTGCSLFCGEQEHNQALLKRVLLAYARWNKTVGYCQGFNMLAALILQVMEKKEKDAVKVMIYLIEGLLPESYFANNLRGLSVDMAVFRDLLRLRLPKLSKHLETLQNDTNAVNVYEPPLTNVFTMQWFLTLFSNCLPQQAVLRVWDLVFLHGNEILLRTALAIWEVLQDRIITVESADEFYSIMGVVTREMLEFGLMDANALVKKIAMVDPFPNELHELREKYLYNISPWSQSVHSAAKKGIKLFYSDQDDQDDTEDEEKIAIATAYGVLRRKESTGKELQLSGPTLDLNVLKQQYMKLRERQRQAHVIITAAGSSIPRNISGPSVSVNHLLLGKSALVNKGRRIGPPEGSIPPPAVHKKGTIRQTNQLKAVKSTNHQKNNKIFNDKRENIKIEKVNNLNNKHQKPTERILIEQPEKLLNATKNNWNSLASDSSSTSTELCDEEFNRDKDLEDVSDYEVSNDKCFNSPSLVPVLNNSPVPMFVETKFSPTLNEQFENHSGCDKENYLNAKALAIQLVREIEDQIKSSLRFQEKNEGNKISDIKKDLLDQNQIKPLDNTVEIVSSLNVLKKQFFSEDFLKSEPKVPIKKNVIKNCNEAEVLKKEGEDRQKEIKKSDLGLSIMKENQDMLHKFSYTKKRKEKIENVCCQMKVDNFDCKSNNKKEKEEKKKPQENLKNVFQLNEEECLSKPIRLEIANSFWTPHNDLVEKAISPIVPANSAIAKAVKVNKKINTEITFGVEEVEISASKTKTFLNEKSKPESSNNNFFKEVTKLGEKSKKYRQFLEDFGPKDEIKAKIEVSKSDWEIKMKKIAELEATARETLNEIQTQSFNRRSFQKSLDGNAKQRYLDIIVPQNEQFTFRPSVLMIEKNFLPDKKEEKVHSSSFDEITSRTEKLLGYLECDTKALELDTKSKDCASSFKSQNAESFDDKFKFSASNYFKSSPTNEERWMKGVFFHSIDMKNNSNSFAEASYDTFFDADYRWTKPKSTEGSCSGYDKNEYLWEQRKRKCDRDSSSKKSGLHLFPTKSFSSSKELNS